MTWLFSIYTSIYNSDLLYESIYKIYNLTNLKYYIYDLINSKSKEKAVRNAESKMCLQRCFNFKKVVKAFDVENKLCLQWILKCCKYFQHRYLNVKTLVDQRCPLKSQILNAVTTFVNYDRKLLKELFSWNAFYMSVVLYLPFWLVIISDLLQRF